MSNKYITIFIDSYISIKLTIKGQWNYIYIAIYIYSYINIILTITKNEKSILKIKIIVVGCQNKGETKRNRKFQKKRAIPPAKEKWPCAIHSKRLLIFSFLPSDTKELCLISHLD